MRSSRSAEPAYELLGVGLRALHAQRQRAQPAQREPGLERPGDRADQVAASLERVVELVVAGDHGAHDHVGVAGDVLGRASAPRGRRPMTEAAGAPGWRRCCRPRPWAPARWAASVMVAMSATSIAGLVGDSSQTSAASSQAALDGLGVGDVDELGLHAPTQLQVGELHHRAGVGVPGRDHLLAVADEVEDRRHGGQTAAERQAASALEAAERLLERGPRRVGVAAVLEIAPGGVRRGQHDRLVERLVGLVRGPTEVHGLRRGAHVVSLGGGPGAGRVGA